MRSCGTCTYFKKRTDSWGMCNGPVPPWIIGIAKVYSDGHEGDLGEKCASYDLHESDRKAGVVHKKVRRPVRLAALFPGSTQIAVYRPKDTEPHFIISGADISDIDVDAVSEYMYECDWTDRGAKGYVVPCLRCDEFMLKRSPATDAEAQI